MSRTDNVLSVVFKLSATNSIVDKVDILKSHRNAAMEKLLFLTYNPYLNSFIRNTDFIKVNKENTTRPISETLDEFYEMFMDLNDRKITGDAAKAKIQNFFNKLGAEDSDLYLKVLSRDLRCGLGAGTINRAYANLIPTFEVQLAATYDPGVNYGVNYWYGSPKMDGIRAVFRNGVLLSRKGKDLNGMVAINNEIRDLLTKVDVTMLDGELYLPGMGFGEIQGIVMSKYEVEALKDKIVYNLFLATNPTVSSTREMLSYLDRIRDLGYKHIKPTLYTRVTNEQSAILTTTKQYVEAGYEGIVLRHPDVVYSPKRDKNLVKFKLFEEVDVTITDLIPGTGKYSNMVGSISYTGEFKGRKVMGEVGTGLSDYDRELISKCPTAYIGHTITLKFQELTPPVDGICSLRFPVVLGMKADR